MSNLEDQKYEELNARLEERYGNQFQVLMDAYLATPSSSDANLSPKERNERLIGETAKIIIQILNSEEAIDDLLMEGIEEFIKAQLALKFATSIEIVSHLEDVIVPVWVKVAQLQAQQLRAPIEPAPEKSQVKKVRDQVFSGPVYDGDISCVVDESL